MSDYFSSSTTYSTAEVEKECSSAETSPERFIDSTGGEYSIGSKETKEVPRECSSKSSSRRNSATKEHFTACSLEPSITIGYATDVEGNFDYWSKYIDMSHILRRLPSGDLELFLECHFVYGGDVVDRGPGDLRVLADLLGEETCEYTSSFLN